MFFDGAGCIARRTSRHIVAIDRTLNVLASLPVRLAMVAAYLFVVERCTCSARFLASMVNRASRVPDGALGAFGGTTTVTLRAAVAPPRPPRGLPRPDMSVKIRPKIRVPLDAWYAQN